VKGSRIGSNFPKETPSQRETGWGCEGAYRSENIATLEGGEHSSGGWGKGSCGKILEMGAKNTNRRRRKPKGGKGKKILPDGKTFGVTERRPEIRDGKKHRHYNGGKGESERKTAIAPRTPV